MIITGKLSRWFNTTVSTVACSQRELALELISSQTPRLEHTEENMTGVMCMLTIGMFNVHMAEPD